jgi:hypothetical protein
MDNTNQVLQDKFSSLPPELQDAITESGFVNKLKEISKTEKLMIDQAGSLEREVLLVLLGITPINQFEKNLKDETRLETEKLKRVISQVNEQIFSPIHQHLEHLMSAAENSPSNIIETPLAPVQDDQKVSEPDRQKILNEIENPVLATPAKKVEKVVKDEIIPIIPTKDVPPPISDKTLTANTSTPVNNLVVSKLNQPITSTAEKISTPKSSDPYREPAI